MPSINKQILFLKLKDYIYGESIFFRKLLVWTAAAIGWTLWLLGKKIMGFQMLGKSHSFGNNPKLERRIERWIRQMLRNPEYQNVFLQTNHAFLNFYCNSQAMQNWTRNPQHMIGSRVLIVKSHQDDEKGVIILDYSYVFPLFIKLFDIERIISKYYLVLEPSWSGYCTLEILSYATLSCPVFVQAAEPHDAVFIDSLKSNLISVPISANWWVDHRIFRPDATVKKEIDLIMVAAWSGFKRHWSFFQCLYQMRKKGKCLKVCLVGYPHDYTMANIAAVAEKVGVLDQIEFYERLSPPEVAKQLNRAKALVLWSRREGFNRAIIEAMLTDIPVILREGFNYGYHYPYINDKTGLYATEESFEKNIDFILKNLRFFSPREWIMTNMTCQHATTILQQRIRDTTEKIGDRWSRDLVVKTTALNSQNYWDKNDSRGFEHDYNFLTSCILHK